MTEYSDIWIFGSSPTKNGEWLCSYALNLLQKRESTLVACHLNHFPWIYWVLLGNLVGIC